MNDCDKSFAEIIEDLDKYNSEDNPLLKSNSNSQQIKNIHNSNANYKKVGFFERS